MPKAQPRDPDKERYWRPLLRRWRRSGLTGRAFCARHRLSEPSFYAWRREIARRDQEAANARHGRPRTAPPPATERPAAAAAVPAFLRVRLADAAPAPGAIEVLLAQGRRLRVAPGFDADLLRQLLHLLEEPP